MANKRKRKTRDKNKGVSQKRLIQQYRTLFENEEYSSALQLLDNVSDDSNLDQILFLKSKVFHKVGDVENALKLLQKANGINPKNLEYLLYTAQIQEEDNNLLQALMLYSKVFQIEPRDISSLMKMGMLLERLERFDQAIVCYKKLLKLKKDDPVSIRRIGLCYYHLGDLSKAADYYEKAISLGGDTSPVWLLIGALFLSKGDRENAANAFKKALTIDRTFYAAYPQYIKSANLSKEECDDLIDRLENLIKVQATLPTQKRLCHFSLGDLYHKQENFREAINNYEFGNRYRAEVVGSFTIEPLLARLNWCRSHLHKDLYATHNKRTSSYLSQPVFVVGMPRSGTSLLEQIIASHSLGFGAGELPTIKRIIHDLGGLGGYNDQFLVKIRGLTSADIEQYIEKYMSELTRYNQVATRIVDKMPHNLMHLWMIGLLFPEAAVIHCARDPLDTCLSCFFTDFNDMHTYKESLYKLGQYYSVYNQFMAHWEDIVPNPILRVQYEEVVDNPESMTRKIIEHIGLEWDSNCLKLRDKHHFSRTASNLQIREGIYKTSVKRWQKYEKYLDELKRGLEDGKVRALQTI